MLSHQFLENDQLVNNILEMFLHFENRLELSLEVMLKHLKPHEDCNKERTVVHCLNCLYSLKVKRWLHHSLQ